MPDPPPPPTARPDASGPKANQSIFDGYGFPVYSPLQHLCGRRDFLPGGGNRTWDAFSSSDEPAALVGYFQGRLGERGFSADGKTSAWRLPPESPAPDRTLTIYAARRPGPHAACDQKPGPDARSVIVLTREH